VWQALAAKELLCEELDRAVVASAGSGAAPPVPTEEAASEDANEAAVSAKWSALPALAGASEKKMIARRDGALRALADAGAAAEYASRIEKGVGVRQECLLELETALKLDSPAELQAYRLALQVKQLKERFSSAAAGGAKTQSELLLAWCSQPGVADARDRQRCERVFKAMAKGA
jgi:hypothetical protein